jgi:hypothetical protein
MRHNWPGPWTGTFALVCHFGLRLAHSSSLHEYTSTTKHSNVMTHNEAIPLGLGTDYTSSSFVSSPAAERFCHCVPPRVEASADAVNEAGHKPKTQKPKD